ncbi:hypothetical protein PCANC_02496 [Puccinia coronata f. sp. avenae]|uniref:Uncharacterized protein n=1 Tax=Puccinia coronata f. sp. avenae TaxID=200324 RepID=A0A2N5VKZ0_9BASI|nr:hypothetical protein PCANC_03794 [Puccinia coronata f. sp. avenae]PLW23100.1 hypothetical protein PCASD_10531 [Puccinia coronata f. sp. avenae]PLW50654.1 hypothetical protein PCASD_00751 [Puccinia coronata f. sp. avenae]PLW55071.1 hypothetical protein PCANC_02496 [Puccinia coronata f. sp. avenae]
MIPSTHFLDANARKEAALRITIDERLTESRSFTKNHGFLTSGIVEFIEYLVCSGRLDEQGGSQWWRGVNGLLILDLMDAEEALRPSTQTVACIPPAVQHWMNYALYWQQTSFPNLFKAQRLWWKAHQTSLHHGIHTFRELLLIEPRMEINFITYICVPNVDLTAILTIPTNLKLIKLYTIIAYPHHYPSKVLSTLKALLLAPSFYARLVGATSDVANIGLDSSRWET